MALIAFDLGRHNVKMTRDDVWLRFVERAEDVGVPLAEVDQFLAHAYDGDPDARELVETTCDVYFLAFPANRRLADRGHRESEMTQAQFKAVVELMDDEIRERLHDEMAPCGEQEFLDAYRAAHQAKFDEEFVVN